MTPSRSSFPSRLAAIAAATLAFATALPALAADLVLTPSGPGRAGTTFTQAASGLVIDDFGFAPLAFDSTFSVTLASLAGPVTFFTAAFFPDTAAEIDFSNLTDVAGGSFSFAAPVSAGTPVTLRVFGAATDASSNFVDGSYRVTVLAAVPEPATVALLLAGLGAVGVAARRRRT